MESLKVYFNIQKVPLLALLFQSFLSFSSSLLPININLESVWLLLEKDLLVFIMAELCPLRVQMFKSLPPCNISECDCVWRCTFRR